MFVIERGKRKKLSLFCTLKKHKTYTNQPRCIWQMSGQKYVYIEKIEDNN